MHSAIEHAAAKLDTLMKEAHDLLECHTHSSRVIQELDDAIRSTLESLEAPQDLLQEDRPMSASLPTPLPSAVSAPLISSAQPLSKLSGMLVVRLLIDWEAVAFPIAVLGMLVLLD